MSGFSFQASFYPGLNSTYLQPYLYTFFCSKFQLQFRLMVTSHVPLSPIIGGKYSEFPSRCYTVLFYGIICTKTPLSFYSCNKLHFTGILPFRKIPEISWYLDNLLIPSAIVSLNNSSPILFVFNMARGSANRNVYRLYYGESTNLKLISRSI